MTRGSCTDLNWPDHVTRFYTLVRNGPLTDLTAVLKNEKHLKGMRTDRYQVITTVALALFFANTFSLLTHASPRGPPSCQWVASFDQAGCAGPPDYLPFLQAQPLYDNDHFGAGASVYLSESVALESYTPRAASTFWNELKGVREFMYAVSSQICHLTCDSFF